jgi:hypothetical protein
MATEENDLDQLYTEMERVVGPRSAATLMRHLPPVAWPDVATKADIEGLRVATKSDIDELRVATKADIDDLRVATKADIDDLRVATKADIDDLRVATKGETHGLQQQITKLDTDLQVGLAKLESSILQRMTSQTLSTIFALVTVVIAISSVALIR